MDRILKAYLDSIQSVGKANQLRNVLTTIASSLGLHSYAYLAMSDAAKPLLISNYSPDWTAHYLAQGHHLFDPVIRRSLRSTNPFGWGLTSSDRIAL